MNGAQLLKDQDDSSGLMSGPPAWIMRGKDISAQSLAENDCLLLLPECRMRFVVSRTVVSRQWTLVSLAD
jgi:hypothetical protein